MTFEQIVVSVVFAVVLVPLLVLAVYVAEHLDMGKTHGSHR